MGKLNLRNVLTNAYAYAKLYTVSIKTQTKNKIKKGAEMFKKLQKTKTYKVATDATHKIYAIWYVAVTILSAILIYSVATTQAEVFLSASLFLLGLVKLVTSLK